MFLKITTIVFYVMIALWAFDIAFPILMILIGLTAAILAIAHAIS